MARFVYILEARHVGQLKYCGTKFGKKQIGRPKKEDYTELKLKKNSSYLRAFHK